MHASCIYRYTLIDAPLQWFEGQKSFYVNVAKSFGDERAVDQVSIALLCSHETSLSLCAEGEAAAEGRDKGHGSARAVRRDY